MDNLKAVQAEESLASTILPIIFSFLFVAILTLALRLYARVLVLRKPAIDDAFAALASISSILFNVWIAIDVSNGLGRHIGALSQDQITATFKALYVVIIFYGVSIAIVKLSIILQYLRICLGRLERRTCFVVIIILVIISIEHIVTSIFTCTPIAYFWDKTIPGGTCVNKLALYFSNSAFNIATDFVLLLLPFFLLRHLIVPFLQKLALVVILAFGAFATIASILRLRFLYVSRTSTDLTWDAVNTMLWSSIEVNMGIICANVATLKPMLPKGFFGRFGRHGLLSNDRAKHSINLQVMSDAPTTKDGHSKHSVGGKDSEVEFGIANMKRPASTEP